MSIITEEETKKLDAIREKLKTIKDDQRLLEDERVVVAEAIFLRFLQAGKWNVSKVKTGADEDLMKITPANDVSEKSMTHLLMETFDLGWHDNFLIGFPSGYVEGRVDDGRLSLYLDFYGTLKSKKVQEGLRALNVDFDFGNMIRESTHERIDALQNQIRNATAERDHLLEQMKELRTKELCEDSGNFNYT